MQAVSLFKLMCVSANQMLSGHATSLCSGHLCAKHEQCRAPQSPGLRAPMLLCRESTLQLDQVSPALAALGATAVPMPGHPRPPPAQAAESAAEAGAVTVAGVAPVVTILKTKTRPKKLALLGSDGRRYMYLLKVHAAVLQTLISRCHVPYAASSCTICRLL